MLHFFEVSWPFWWVVAVLAILRWFQVNVASVESEDELGYERSPEISTRQGSEAFSSMS